MKCKTCQEEYSPACDYRQGRCPLHPPMISGILIDKFKMRFYNLLRKIGALK